MLLVGAEIDDAVADNNVGPAVLYRYLFQKSLAKLDLLEPHELGRCAGLFQHFREQVDADDFAVRAHLMGSDEAVKPAFDPASTTFSPGSRARNANGFATPANDSTATSGIESTSVWS